MSRESEVWKRLARQAGSPVDVAPADPALVARIVESRRTPRTLERRSADIWQKAGFRTAIAVAAVAVLMVLLNRGALAENFGQGLSFLHEVTAMETLP